MIKILTNRAKLREAYEELDPVIRAEPSIFQSPRVEFDASVLEDDFVDDAAAKRRKIYLSGPMKGYPESNYPLFMRVAESLRALGHTVYNPAEFPHDGPHEAFPIRKAFAAYCDFICNEADTIVLLPGFEKSKGAGAELALARNCGLEIVELNFSFDLFV